VEKAPHRRASRTIKALIAVIGLVIIALWAVVAVSSISARRAAMDHARIEAHNLTGAFASETGHTLDEVASSMELIAQRMRAELNKRPDISAWARDIPLLSVATIQAALIGSDGWLIGTTLDPAPAPLYLGDREHIRVHLDGPKLPGIFIGKPVLGRVSNQVTIQITRRIDAEDGRFLGVLLFSLSPARLSTLPATIDLHAHGTLTLVGLDGMVRARFTQGHPDGLVGVGLSVAGGSRPTEFPENADGFFVKASAIDGLSRLFAYRRLGAYPLVVTVGLDLSEIYAATNAHSLILAAIAAVATVLLLSLLAYLVREIGVRAAHEGALAEEQIKMLAANIALTESKERAECASEAKSLFLANMSHELRTPLNAIIGYSEVIKDQSFGPSAAGRYIEYAGDIFASGHHLLSLILDILDTAKLDAGKFELEEEIVDLAALVDRSLAQVRLAIENKGLRLELRIPTKLPKVRVDASRLNQVLINLLSNAIKFTPRGGLIEIAAECDIAGEMICKVSDTGIGMSAGDLLVALEPFSQVGNGLSKSHQGTGLGLPLAKRLVELHGGVMEIESAKGNGTTVLIRLPAERTIRVRLAEMTPAAAAA
jgi:signal transduction histidine kinase